MLALILIFLHKYCRNCDHKLLRITHECTACSIVKMGRPYYQNHAGGDAHSVARLI